MLTLLRQCNLNELQEDNILSPQGVIGNASSTDCAWNWIPKRFGGFITYWLRVYRRAKSTIICIDRGKVKANQNSNINKDRQLVWSRQQEKQQRSFSFIEPTNSHINRIAISNVICCKQFVELN
jgi:hypothetical protein